MLPIYSSICYFRTVKKIVVILLLLSRIGFSQELQTQERHAKKWLDLYDQMDENFPIPDETLTRSKALKAREKVIGIMEKSLQKAAKHPEDPESYDHLMQASANASLWYRYIQGDHFSRLLKRLLTDTQIGRDRVHDVRDAYHKWMIQPSVANLNKYSDILLQTGRSYEVLCDLTLVDKITDGSRLKYRSLNGRRSQTLDASGIKRVPVGNYYLWREKDGKISSEYSEANFCITKEQQVSLEMLQD
jgi:hypothetical protein